MDWLYGLLGSMLSWFSSWTGSYAIALLFYALIFKVLFLPFSIKQQKNQIALAKLTPKIELIKAKYKGRTDQATMRKQQEEIMELQQKEGYSAFSGCLPLLIQLPLIIFLYNVIRNPLSYIAKFSDEVIVKLHNLINGAELAVDKISSIDQITLAGKVVSTFNDGSNASYIESILNEAGADISVIPNFNLWGVNLAATPSLISISILVLIPIFAAGLQWFTMWLTRKLSGNANQLAAADATAQTNMSMKIMDLVMPAMTLWLTFSFSGMMGLYWIYQSIITIIQTLILHKFMPIPKFTEEEIKAIRKAQKQQEKAQKAIIKTQPKYKSLHYIDEDDYDDLPEIKNNQNKNQKPMSGDDRPEIKD